MSPIWGGPTSAMREVLIMAAELTSAAQLLLLRKHKQIYYEHVTDEIPLTKCGAYNLPLPPAVIVAVGCWPGCY